MNEILAGLKPCSIVLDLGSGAGSFDAEGLPCKVVRADLAFGRRNGLQVACTASALPFAGGAFDAVILNHSLEHMEELDGCIREIGRVIAPSGLLYVAVPDATTITDRVYRWIARGGGHVNPFRRPEEVVRKITAGTGLRHCGTRLLCTSLAFLHRSNISGKPPGKLLLFGNGSEAVLRALTYGFRRLDKWLGTRASIYGWAFWFGEGISPETDTWTNVCVRCGAGHPEANLVRAGRVTRRRWLPSYYRCLQCGVRNYFTADSEGIH